MFENGLAPKTDLPKVALLIDGENISSALAGKIIVESGKLGELRLRRVYGNATLVKGWDTATGIRLVHSGTGKNAADIVLALDAMELSYESKIDVFALVSSDGDFMHLADRLRERGFKVVGIGEKKAPDCFRKSCSSWVTLAAPVAPKANGISATKTAVTKTTAAKRPTDDKVASKAGVSCWAAISPNNPVAPSFDDEVQRIVRAHPEGITMSGVNIQIRSGLSGRISDQKQKTWESYFKARPGQYAIDRSASPSLIRDVSHADSRIAACIEGHPDGLLIGQINTQMVKNADVRLADVMENTWRQYFKARPNLYSVKGTGQDTRIRLNKA
ncbi:NYN domain-containing protein [Aliiroseovarius sp. S1339]|uniref:NYN domain-containing protein n=1 Tax=Aliiroseovarius sp. S1339 TaxID=2936990 RepID=UPI0020BE4D14|nr:NYN domain-containing protein [Aliiroseovarius sp. S1339]MCK8463844.1 NYN domain-containing protein [Aliiroseovarius sp. S1339]